MSPFELTCVECSRVSHREARGWQGFLIDVDDDGQDEVVFYCPQCAAREFGDPGIRRRQRRET